MARVLGVLKNGTPIHIRVPVPPSTVDYALDFVFRPYESNSGMSFTSLYIEVGNEMRMAEGLVTLTGRIAADVTMMGTELGETIDAVLSSETDPDIAIDKLRNLGLLPARVRRPLAVLVDVSRCGKYHHSTSRILVLERVHERRLYLGKSITEQGHLAVFKIDKFIPPPGYDAAITFYTNFYNHYFSYPLPVYSAFFGNTGDPLAIAVYVGAPVTISSPDHPGEEIVLKDEGWYILYHPRPQGRMQAVD